MKSIEEYVEIYDEGHSSVPNIILHIAGILIATTGLMCLLWQLPDAPIKSWLGNHPFANWATVYAVITIIYYGSQSFSLTFAGGIFFEGYLFLIEYLEAAEFVPFEYLTGGLIISGFILMAVGHLIEGNIGAFTKDIRYFILSPTWIFRFIYRTVGVAF